MDKRLGLALAISMAILFIWWKIFPPQQPLAPPPPPVAQSTAPPPSDVPAGAAPGAPGADRVAAQPGVAAPAPEELVTLESSEVRFVLSSWGGALRELKVKETKFREHKNDPETGLVVARAI